MSVEFFCVSGRDYFLGALALVNSLRLVGHTERITLLDCGLDESQRAFAESEVNIVAAPDDLPASMQKFVAPLRSTADVLAVLDADMIVTRNLGDLFDRAADGALVGFRNESHRWFEEWGTLLGRRQLRQGPYLSSGALIMNSATARELLPFVQEHQEGLDQSRTWLGNGVRSDPFFFADQDLVNAVTLARLPPERVVALDARLAPVPPFAGVRIRDRSSLRCEYADGARPFVLHHFFRKPWLVKMRSNVYTRLFTRVVLGGDVALRPRPSSVPLRLRSGAAGSLAAAATDVVYGIPDSLRRRRPRREPERISAWTDSPPGDAG